LQRAKLFSNVGMLELTPACRELTPACRQLAADPSLPMAAGMHDLVKRHRLRPDPEGPIQILEKFWQFAPVTTSETPPGVAPPLLVYADLLASRDPRNAEVAQMIKEKYLDHAQN
jgi:hypothetical protein